MKTKTLSLRLGEQLIADLKKTAESMGISYTEFIRMSLVNSVISFNDRRERAGLVAKTEKKPTLYKTLSPVEKMRLADLKDFLTLADKIVFAGDLVIVKSRPRRKDGTIIENYNGYASTTELKTAELEKYELLASFQEKAQSINPITEEWEKVNNIAA